ncbi:MAG: hypothetical protein SFU56_22655 [Capsulimonadales bacterium]|nr:hypothetical protein [Capsulimonadales bacterium]
MRFFSRSLGSLTASVATVLVGIAPVWSAPTFFVAPGTDPDLDLAWRSLAPVIFEQDFDSLATATPFSVGPVSITATEVGTGQPLVLFPGSWGVTSSPGTVFGQALLPQSGNVPTLFTLSQPVEGFGLWIFDDFNSTGADFSMTVNGVTSPALTTLHIPGGGVAGFLGVHDPAGISEVTITMSTGVFYEMDHVQVFGVSGTAAPEPATLALLLPFAVGVIARRKK